MNSTPSKRFAPFRAQVIKDIFMFFRIGFEFWRGFHFLRHTKRAVTIFGSARFPDDHPYCRDAYKIAQYLGRRGFAVITGGGPSIMQAANQGAFEVGAHTVGINIEIPREQKINPYVKAALKCRYFFVRKVLLTRYSEAFVVLPGGFGTLDELFEILSLMQTGKMIPRLVVLVDQEYWNGLIDWARTTLVMKGALKKDELDRLIILKNADEAITFLGKNLL